VNSHVNGNVVVAVNANQGGSEQPAPVVVVNNDAKIVKRQVSSIILEIEVEVKQGGFKPIWIRQEDNLKEVAHEFCVAHDMADYTQALAVLIEKSFNENNINM
jgi:hypothetical protein